jgi:hypothetical protein
MKFFTSLLIAILGLAASANAQTKDDIFARKVPLTWLGLDFSQLYFVADMKEPGKVSGVSNEWLRDKHFKAWNDLFVTEEDKYDVAKATRRKDVMMDLEVTARVNNALKREFFTEDDSKYQLLTVEKVKDLVAAYDFGDNKGLGLLFFVEGISYRTVHGSMWMTFVNMDKKEVLRTLRVETKARGSMTFANTWANTFRVALELLARVDK